MRYSGTIIHMKVLTKVESLDHRIPDGRTDKNNGVIVTMAICKELCFPWQFEVAISIEKAL